MKKVLLAQNEVGHRLTRMDTDRKCFVFSVKSFEFSVVNLTAQ